MSDVTPDFRIDWDNDGTWTDTGENITTRLGDEIGIRYGRDQARSLAPVSPGEMSFGLQNDSKDYSPENGSSPIAANLLSARPVKYEATHSATTYTPFRGFLDDYKVSAEEQEVGFTAVDALARLKGVKISTALHKGLTTGAVIGKILDEIGWPSGSRDLDSGATYIPFWWEEGTEAWTALEKVLNSEGPPALVYVDYATGNFVFRDRHHRITRTASTTSQATFRDTAPEPVFSAPFSYEAGWKDVINTISISVDERAPDAWATVWESDRTYNLSASEVLEIEAEASDPFMSARTPESGTDFTLHSGTVTVGLSRDSGQSTTITLTAGGSGCRITDLSLKAFPIPVRRTIKVSASDSTSITQYGEQSYPLDIPWCNANDARAVADLIIRYRKQKLAVVQMHLDGLNDDTCMTQQLVRKLSDRVTVVETQTALNSAFYIEQVQHTVKDSGKRIETTFGLEKVPPSVPAAGFILGTSLLNTGVLGF